MSDITRAAVEDAGKAAENLGLIDAVDPAAEPDGAAGVNIPNLSGPIFLSFSSAGLYHQGNLDAVFVLMFALKLLVVAIHISSGYRALSSRQRTSFQRPLFLYRRCC